MILKPHVVLAGGGRLGSLYPGLALAELLMLRCPQVEISLMGSGAASERHHAQAAGLNYLSVPSQPAPRSPLECLRYVSDNAAGYLAAGWLLGERRVSLVVGLGGSVSAVACRAACSRGVPLMLLEGNAVVSNTARRLGAHAEAVCLAYEHSQAQLPATTPTVLTGTPVRSEFLPPLNSSPHEASAEKLLVVLAGATARQARSLNNALPTALARLGSQLDGWRVVHQCGEGELRETEQRYHDAGAPAVVVSHVDQMADLLGEANLVIGRAGGSTLAELAVRGAAAIFAPCPDAENDHQIANARLLEQAGACLMVDPRAAEPLAAGLQRALERLLHDDLRRAKLSEAIRSWARPDAAEQIADLCAGVLGLSPLRAAA